MHAMQIWMQDDADDLTEMRNNNGIPQIRLKKKGSDFTRGNVVLLGKMIVHCRIGSER